MITIWTGAGKEHVLSLGRLSAEFFLILSFLFFSFLFFSFLPKFVEVSILMVY